MYILNNMNGAKIVCARIYVKPLMIMIKMTIFFWWQCSFYFGTLYVYMRLSKTRNTLCMYVHRVMWRTTILLLLLVCTRYFFSGECTRVEMWVGLSWKRERRKKNENLDPKFLSLTAFFGWENREGRDDRPAATSFFVLSLSGLWLYLLLLPLF